MASSFNNLFLIPSLSLQQSSKFGVKPNLIFNFAFTTAWHKAAAFPTVICIPPALLPQNQLPDLFAQAWLCNRQMRSLHLVRVGGAVPGGSF